MIRFSRAAGIAAALFLTVGAAFPATPSLAWELNAPAFTPLPVVAPELPAPKISAEATPVAAEPASLPEFGQLSAPASPAAVQPSDAELECLAGAVYFEAKGEPLKGQLSVARVILNRARSGRFPTTACGVVKQRGQFSFIRAGRFPPIARASAAWRTAVAIAHTAHDKAVASPAGKALFFHARSVSPGWSGVTRIATIGNHVFYR